MYNAGVVVTCTCLDGFMPTAKMNKCKPCPKGGCPEMRMPESNPFSPQPAYEPKSAQPNIYEKSIPVDAETTELPESNHGKKVVEVEDAAAAEEAVEAADEEPCVVPSTCVPFKYYEVLYDGCTAVGTGGEGTSDAWCATATDDDGSFVVGSGNYEYCDKACTNPPADASLVLSAVSEGVRLEDSSTSAFPLIGAAALVVVVAAVAAAGWKRRSHGFAEEQGMWNDPIHAGSYNGGPVAQL